MLPVAVPLTHLPSRNSRWSKYSAPPGRQGRALKNSGPDLCVGHRDERLMALILLVLLLALPPGGAGAFSVRGYPATT